MCSSSKICSKTIAEEINMKSLVAGLCFIFAQAVTAQSTCIPRTFAEGDIVASYEKVNADKIAELAARQKEYANFAEQVRTKKSTDNKIELTNAFVDAAAISYTVHYFMKKVNKSTMFDSFTGDDLYVLNEGVNYDDDSAKIRNKLSENIKNIDDATKAKLRKKFGKKYENKVVNMIVNAKDSAAGMDDFIDQVEEEGTKKTLVAKLKERLNIPKRLKGWFKSLKGLSFAEQMKKTVFTVGKKLGFTSMVAALPLGAYVGLIKIQEQQRLVQLTAEQDKVMKQALLLELFLNQKSFAELAATRAQLNPDAVCPSA